MRLIAGIIQWLVYLPLWAVINIMARLLCPFLPLFATDQYGNCDNNNGKCWGPRLSPCLSWFMTPDNSLYGDNTFASRHDGKYWSQVVWLWRNPAIGFETSVLATSISANSNISPYGNVNICDGENAVAGICLVLIKQYWHLKIVMPTGNNRCFYCNLGWLLSTYAEDKSRLSVDSVAQYVVSPRFSKFGKE